MTACRPAVLAALITLATASSAWAQSGRMAPASTNTPPGPAMEGNANSLLSQADRDFLDKDAQGAAYERELADLAVRKSENPAVKRYAQQVAGDHLEYNAALQTLGENNGVTLPAAPDTNQAARLGQLAAMSGQEFDGAFVQEMRDINKDDASDAQVEADSTMNAGVRNFVLQFKAMDARHLKDARDLPSS